MLPPTLDLAVAARRAWDVIVVGAGPAGALAAHEMARRQCSVLLVERSSLPRWKVCGCCFNQLAQRTLSANGLGALLSQHAVPLRTVRLAAPEQTAEVVLPGWSALSRTAFDTALVRAALQEGAHFLPQTEARLGQVDARFRTVTLQGPASRGQVHARLVLAADGLGGRLLAGAQNLETRIKPNTRMGAGVVADSPPAFYTPGKVFMACGVGGYVGLVRLEDGRLDMAAAFDREFVRRLGHPGKAAQAILREVAWPAPADVASRPWRGTPGLTRQRASLSAERVFVLGDAAGYVEPFTGEGISWALRSAAVIAPLALRAVGDWHSSLGEEWTSLHQRHVRRRQLWCRAAAWTLRRPSLVQLAIRLLTRFPAAATPFA